MDIFLEKIIFIYIVMHLIYSPFYKKKTTKKIDKLHIYFADQTKFNSLIKTELLKIHPHNLKPTLEPEIGLSVSGHELG